ncbi:MAG TPA: serine/threonine-protein kinase [Polyangiaceae bacterium]
MGREGAALSCFETQQTQVDGSITAVGTVTFAPNREPCPRPRFDAGPHVTEVVGGKYKLLRPLGGGGMGSVWVAEHLTLQALVAVKFMRPASRPSRQARARFTFEARSAAQLRSSHIVQVFDYGTSCDVPYIAMELLQGETLAARLARRGVLSARDTARVLAQIARAMARAHARGVVHRDLKPANVFLVREDGREIVKVLDFGVAKSERAAPKYAGTDSGCLIGTPGYFSPEQADGEREVDHRSDLWAMGVIAFECITGQRPFHHKNLGGVLLNICVNPIPVPSRLAPVPPGFDRWFAKAVARSPEERFESASALANALTELVNASSDSSTRRAAAQRALRSSRHVVRVALWVAAVLLVLLALTGLVQGPP